MFLGNSFSINEWLDYLQIIRQTIPDVFRNMHFVYYLLRECTIDGF